MSRASLDSLEHSRGQHPIGGSSQQWLFSSKSHRQIVEEDPFLQPADLAAAKEKREKTGTGFDINDPKIIHAHRTPELAEHGVGIHLYFQFILELSIMFLLLFLVKLPQTFFSTKGTMLRLTSLYTSLLGNLGLPNEYDGHDPRVAAMMIRDRPVYQSMSIQRMILWFGILDLICTLLVGGFCLYFIRYRVAQVCSLNDKLRHTLADYTIMVTRLPPKLDPSFHRKYRSLLRHHFLDILEDCPLPPSDPYCPRWARVKEIVIVRIDQNGIETLMELGRLKHHVALMEARSRCGGIVRQSQLDKTLAKIDNIVARLRSASDLSSKEKPVSTAFISFQHASDKDYLVKSYVGSKSWILQKSQAPSLRFHGYPLKVITAPEPEDIIWESLNVPHRERVKSTILIWIIVGVCLICSFVISFLLMGIGGYIEPHRVSSEAEGYALRRQISGDTGEFWILCDFKLYTDYTCTSELTNYQYRPLSNYGAPTMEKTSDDKGTKCTDTSSIYRTVAGFTSVGLDAWFPTPTKVGCVRFKQALFDENSNVIADGGELATKNTASLEACDLMPDRLDKTSSYPLCTRIQTGYIKESQDWPLMRWNQKTTNECSDVTVNSWEGLGEHLTASTDDTLNNHEWYLNCFCSASMSLKRVTDCREYYKSYIVVNASMYGMLLSIAIINTALQYLIQWLVWHWEYPVSSSQRMSMSFSKIFIAQYLNSGFNVLLTGGFIFPREINVGEKTIGGLYGDMAGGWYESVGSRLMSYGYFFIFFPQLFAFIFPLIFKVYRAALRRNQKIQYDLDLLYAKAEFALDSKLAAVVAIACFMLTYTGPMPMMPLCGCLAMFTLYWSDKYEFIYESRQPPKYNEQIINVAVALLQVGLIVRTGISMAAFGHPLVAPSCSIHSGSDSFIDMIIASAEKEQTLLTYEYVPPRSAVLAPSWIWPRFKSYLLSCGSFPSTIYAIILACIVVNLILYSIFFACRVSESGVVTKTWVKLFDTLTDHIVPRETYDELQEKLNSRGLVSSYKMNANPAYRIIERARKQYYRIRSQSKGQAMQEEPTDSESSSSEDSEYPKTGRVADMKAFKKLVDKAPNMEFLRGLNVDVEAHEGAPVWQSAVAGKPRQRIQFKEAEKERLEKEQKEKEEAEKEQERLKSQSRTPSAQERASIASMPMTGKRNILFSPGAK